MKRIAEIFAINLKRFRETRGYTQEELAHRVGVTMPALQNWEYQKKWPKAESIDRLAKVLGVSISDLFEEPREATRSVWKAADSGGNVRSKVLREIDGLESGQLSSVLSLIEAFSSGRGRKK